MTAAGNRQVRRAVMARARDGTPAQFVMLTLTSQVLRSDLEMRQALARLLAWGRKYVPAWFGWYVWVAEDQARGVLHFHLLVSRRIPKALYRRVRALWCDTYGMGEGSFDTVKLRFGGKAAVSYLCKYLGKAPKAHRLSLGPDGFLQYQAWRVSRHTGEAYVRERFRGNAYGMTDSARFGTRPLVDFEAPWGAFPGLDGWHGTSHYYDSVTDAEAVLAAVLGVGPDG